MPFTNFLDNALLGYQFGQVAYFPTGNVWLALSTTTPTQTGANFTEPVGNGYARNQVSNASTSYTYSTPGGGGASVTFSSTMYFPTATGSWGTITYWGLYNNLGGGNLLLFAPLTTPQLITSGTPAFPAGSLLMVLD